jgi:hypothetical protein
MVLQLQGIDLTIDFDETHKPSKAYQPISFRSCWHRQSELPAISRPARPKTMGELTELAGFFGQRPALASDSPPPRLR